MPPSSSEAQRKLFGMVLAAKRNQLKNPSRKVEKISKGISENSAEDFARKSQRQKVGKTLMNAKSGY